MFANGLGLVARAVTFQQPPTRTSEPFSGVGRAKGRLRHTSNAARTVLAPGISGRLLKRASNACRRTTDLARWHTRMRRTAEVLPVQTSPPREKPVEKPADDPNDPYPWRHDIVESEHDFSSCRCFDCRRNRGAGDLLTPPKTEQGAKLSRGTPSRCAQRGP